MQNSMEDLNNHLFAQLERLGIEGLSTEQIAGEVEKSKAITIIARQLSENARIELEAKKLLWDSRIDKLPGMLEQKPKPLHVKESR